MKAALRFAGMVLAAAAVLCFVQPTGAQAKSYTLTYSNFFPPSHIQSKLAEQWCKEVEERTDGQVKVIYYPGQTLTQADQCYDGVVTGRSDIGMSCLLYTRGRFPLMDVINLPFGNPSGEFATAVFNEIYDKFKPEELADTKVMYLHAHGPGFIHTKGKAVHTMQDLKGLKIRTPGSVAEMVKQLGATPASMPMPDLYQALQRGVVDGAVYPEETNEGWKMGEVIDYTIACYPIAYSVGFFVVMNQDKWEQLPSDVQKTIGEINKEWAAKHGRAWDKSDFQGIQFNLRQGNTMIGIGEDEAEKWREAIQPVFDTYIEKCEKKDVPGEKALQFLRKRLEEYRKGKFESPYM
jgi:TRAP-type C4-dicarboxylate transport system substrate-binding protein